MRSTSLAWCAEPDGVRAVVREVRIGPGSKRAFALPTVMLHHSGMPKVALPPDWSYNKGDMTPHKSDMAALR
jgi:hypothetical protein